MPQHVWVGEKERKIGRKEGECVRAQEAAIRPQADEMSWISAGSWQHKRRIKVVHNAVKIAHAQSGAGYKSVVNSIETL